MNDTPQRLILIRHAQGSLGTADYDRLSERGHAQAERLGRHVRARYGAVPVVRGGLRRHRETAERIAETHAVDAALDEYRVDRLFEAAFDPASGLDLRPPPEEALADPVAYLQLFLDLFPSVLDAWQREQLSCPQNGSWKAFEGRVSAAGERLIEAAGPGDGVVAVTSAGVISTLVAALLGQPLGWQRDLNVALYNASITELHRPAGGEWAVERINCVDHLAPEQHTLA